MRKEKGENKKADAMSANLSPLEPAKPKPAPIPARPGALMGRGEMMSPAEAGIIFF